MQSIARSWHKEKGQLQNLIKNCGKDCVAIEVKYHYNKWYKNYTNYLYGQDKTSCETTSMFLYNMGYDDNHNATQSILNELQILYHASILLKKKLATVKWLMDPWLPVAEWMNNFTKWISCKEIILQSRINNRFSMFSDVACWVMCLLSNNKSLLACVQCALVKFRHVISELLQKNCLIMVKLVSLATCATDFIF
jgi:hypothetical protein